MQTPKENPNGVNILPGIPDDPDRVTISNRALKKEQCVNDICVKKVVVTCYPDRGSITYKITNKGKEKVSGYLKLEFENFTGYLVYNDLKPGKTTDGYVGYSGYDLRNVKEYKLKKLSNSDYSAFVN